jgi:release factor glutamine methyltransferase
VFNAEHAENETLAEFIKKSAYVLKGKYEFGQETAVFEVELLLEWFLKLDINQIRIRAITGEFVTDLFSADALTNFCRIMERRLDGEPLQYITQTVHFYGLALFVGPGVFIPRPETEKLVSLTLDFITTSKNTTSGEIVLADLCAGSGAIGLALAQNLKSKVALKILAVEKSADAFKYLKKNCARYSDKHSSSVVIPVLADASEVELPPCDAVVLNPPYIPPEVELPLSVRAEPTAALYGLGDDGFEIPHAVVKNAAQSLKPGGCMFLEHFETQSETAAKALPENGLTSIRHILDLNQRPRFTTGMKPSS